MLRRNTVRRQPGHLLPTLLLAALAGCDQPAPVAPDGTPSAAMRVSGVPPTAAERIPDQYIVVFKPDVRDVPSLADALTRAQGGTRLHTYQHAIKGFAARLSAQAAQALTRNPNVASVEQDVVRYGTETVVQNGATWGLDRIDQRERPLNSTYGYEATGEGVEVYILDSGIRYSHAEFEGRASNGVDFASDAFREQGNDCNGHGTHVAATIGGATFGVAKKAQLISVRVLSCGFGGSLPTSASVVIAGVDWVTGRKLASPGTPMVANLSLAGPSSPAEAQAIRTSMSAAQVTYVVAAGNDGKDACNYSPALIPDVITVGATTVTDARASYSNVGACVDLFAPGTDITSAGLAGDGASAVLSGTSMATPHVTGVAALYLETNRGATPAQVTGAIMAASTTGIIADLPEGTANRLLFSRYSQSLPTAWLSVPSDTQFLRTARQSGVTDAPIARNVLVANTGTAAMDWTASVDKPWLTIGSASGTLAAGSNLQLNVTADPSALPLGSHTATVSFASSNAPNAPQSVTVTVHIVAAARLSTEWLTDKYFKYFFLREDGVTLPASDEAELRLSNAGTLGFDWTATASQPGITLTPASGTLPNTGATTVMTVRIEGNAMPLGPITSTVRVQAASGFVDETVALFGSVEAVTRLTAGTPLTDVRSTAPHENSWFHVVVPPAAPENLLIRISGGTTPFFSAVFKGFPTGYNIICYRGPTEANPVKDCLLQNPQPGDYYIALGSYGQPNQNLRIEAIETFTSTDLTVTPATQRYSEAVTLTASVLPADVTGSVQFQMSTDGGTTFGNVGAPVAVANGTASMAHPVLQAAGTALRYRAVFTPGGQLTGSTSPARAVTVTKEDAVIVYGANNPVARNVSTSGGSLNAGALTLALQVREKADPLQSPFLGDIGKAGLTVTLEPAAGGGAVTLSCTDGGVTGTGLAALHNFSCRNTVAVPVNAYEVVATVTGNHYAGRLTDVFTVSDPSLGFATGGGTFQLDGERVNFGFTMKQPDKRTSMRGGLVAVRHHANGTVSRIKSNALGSLALGQDPAAPLGWASFDGRATWTRWDTSVGDYVTIGSQTFMVYVEDRNNPGSGTDRIWLRGPGQFAMQGTLGTASSNTLPLSGGDIAVKHSAGPGRK